MPEILSALTQALIPSLPYNIVSAFILTLSTTGLSRTQTPSAEQPWCLARLCRLGQRDHTKGARYRAAREPMGRRPRRVRATEVKKVRRRRPEVKKRKTDVTESERHAQKRRAEEERKTTQQAGGYRRQRGGPRGGAAAARMGRRRRADGVQRIASGVLFPLRTGEAPNSAGLFWLWGGGAWVSGKKNTSQSPLASAYHRPNLVLHERGALRL